MLKLNGMVTDEADFFQGVNPFELAAEYGSPLYVYNERILRQRCRDIMELVRYKPFKPNYSAKANTNLAFLQIVREEGFDVDAMSPGEMEAELRAGFKPENIIFIANNVPDEEMRFALERGIRISVDSLSQMERLGRLNAGGEVIVRFNPGVGAGHHEKVVTGGSKTKFGVNLDYISEVRELLSRYNLRLVGVNQHIGSLFMDGEPYVEGARNLLEAALRFDSLEFINLGGGFGIPYRKQEGESRLDLNDLGKRLDAFMEDFTRGYGRGLALKVEPGRYVSAESAVLLGSVNAVKYNGADKYIGTDLGFNVLMRVAMYDAYHEVEIYRDGGAASGKTETVSIVGNICESGDFIARDRELPEIFEGDIIGVLDAGAYGHIMSSNYNTRPRTAEVMLRDDGSVALTRKRDTLDDILRNYLPI